MSAPIDNEGVACRAAPGCILCSSPGVPLYSGQRDPLFGSPGIWSTRRCSDPRCAVMWIDPMPEPDSIGALYKGYHTHSASEAGDGPLNPIPYPARSKPLARRALATLMPWWRHHIETDRDFFEGVTPGRMLDVGCGAGSFLRRAAGGGWAATGIDFDAQAIAVAKRVTGAEAHVMDLFDGQLDDRRFEGIMFDNVIEHLPDTARVMARCAELLAPGGRLVMITPNAEALCHDVFKADWRGLETPRHLCIFTGRALQRLARRNGLPGARAFCSRFAADQGFMIDASSEIARLRGNPVPLVDRAGLARRHRREWWRGRTRGEFLVLVANKPVQGRSARATANAGPESSSGAQRRHP